MNKSQLKNEKIFKEIISEIVKNTINFQKLIKRNWMKIGDQTLNKVIKEYLTFIMYCAVYMLQSNEATDTELEEFHKSFYSKIVKNNLLKRGELLDYEKLSRKRYMDFYQTLFQVDDKQLTGKNLNALVAKESLYIQKLLSKFKEKEGAIGELYGELFAVYNSLMLQIQLMAI